VTVRSKDRAPFPAICSQALELIVDGIAARAQAAPQPIEGHN
jgi:hypothetical protein